MVCSPVLWDYIARLETPDCVVIGLRMLEEEQEERLEHDSVQTQHITAYMAGGGAHRAGPFSCRRY